MMPMLKVVMGFFNLVQIIILDLPPLKQLSTSCGLFKGVVLIQEATKGLPKAELSLFHKFHLENVDSLYPLMWWYQ